MFIHTNREEVIELQNYPWTIMEYHRCMYLVCPST